MNWQSAPMRNLVQLALREDEAHSDITTETLISRRWKIRAEIRAKQGGVVAGLPLARLIFKTLDPRIRFSPTLKDGAAINSGKVIARVEGNAKSVLSAERPALNALQHLS